MKIFIKTKKKAYRWKPKILLTNLLKLGLFILLIAAFAIVSKMDYETAKLMMGGS